MLFKMGCEAAKDRIGAAVVVNGGGEMAVKALDRHADGADASLCAIPGPGGVLFLITVKVDEFALCFFLHWLDGVLVFQQGLEFVLLAERGAHDLRGIETEAAFL